MVGMQVAQRARDKGLEFCIVNGLEPESNRAVLELCEKHSTSLLPALGKPSPLSFLTEP
jgi:Tat protein secretion system quality control protein TatD with DNase activity